MPHYKNVILAHDMTKQERIECKTLVMPQATDRSIFWESIGYIMLYRTAPFSMTLKYI